MVLFNSNDEKIIFFIKFIEFEWCGDENSCSDWIYQSYPYIDYKNDYCKISVDAVEGYNKVWYEKRCRVKKGQMVMVNISEPGILAINNNQSSLISDLKINRTAKAAIKLDQLLNFRFLINAITDRKFYKKSIYFTKIFDRQDMINVSAKFLDSSNFYTKKFSILNGKKIKIKLF